jgi:hypothetical protein
VIAGVVANYNIKKIDDTEDAEKQKRCINTDGANGKSNNSDGKMV